MIRLFTALLVSLTSGIGTARVFPASPATSPQRVLVLYSDERLLPANIIIDDAIRSSFAPGSSNQIEFYSEFLDDARFPGEKQEQRQRDFFRDKYQARPPHLVITVSGAALASAVKYRAAVFAGAPIVHYSFAGDPHPQELQDAVLTLEMLGTRVHPEDCALRDEAIQRAPAGAGIYNVDYRVRLPDGSMYWIASNGQVEFDDAGKAVLTRGMG